MTQKTHFDEKYAQAEKYALGNGKAHILFPFLGYRIAIIGGHARDKSYD